MKEIVSGNFNIADIAESGQCFRLTPLGRGEYRTVANGRVLTVSHSDAGARLDCDDADYEGLWSEYFDMGTDYSAFSADIPTEDVFLTKAAEFGKGIRILRQDPWEMLVSFIISQRKSIPAIRSSIEQLCDRYGMEIAAGIHAFPTPQALAKLPLERLNACSLGYRSEYVSAASRMVDGGALDLGAIGKLGDEELMGALLSVRGVGVKVAGCVMLFGYHRLAAFPRDVWINRIIDSEYGGSFDAEPYKGYAGVIQQYMFYYARSTAHRPLSFVKACDDRI